MNKSILALAVAASALTGVAQADGTTLYGEVKATYTYADDNPDTIKGIAKFDGTSSFDASGKFGIKGEDSLGNGLTAFYKYEQDMVKGADLKKLYAGLKGGFGMVSVGKQALPVDALSNYSDPFNSLTPNADKYNVGGKNFDDKHDKLTGAQSNSLVYWTPDMSGFQVGAAIVADGKTTKLDRFSDSKHVDSYQIVAKYEANGFFAGLGYSATNGDQSQYDADAVSLGLGYGNDVWSVGLIADKYDYNKIDPVFARLSATYNINEADSVYAGVSYYDNDIKGRDDQKAYSLGYNHQLSARTNVWAEYSFSDNGNVADDVNTLSLGLKTKF